MSKLIIFDLDGVLVEAKEIHFNSLNLALRDIDEKFVITWEDHLRTYDGLKIKTFDVPKMWGIGTPEDLNYFLENYK